MLFEDTRLHSKFDFGQTLDDGSATITALCQEIIEKSSQILDMLENNEPILLHHQNISGDKIFVPNELYNSEDLFNRDYISIQNIVYRKTKVDIGTHTALSFHLKALGVSEPTKGTNQYKHYLQLLYFFYMMRYFVYPNNNFFLMLKEKHRSTYFVPNDRANGGKYWHFIFQNLFDDPNSFLYYVQCDKYFSTLISNLVNILETKINETQDINQNTHNARKIRTFIHEITKISITPTQKPDPIEQMINAAYQYQMLAYSGDMIKNLDDKTNPFRFEELEYEPLSEWKNRLVQISDIESFLKETNTIIFCRQEKKDYKRPEKMIRGNAFSFIHEIIQYDQALAENNYPRLFTKEIGKDIVIQADYIALLVKTYLDCNINMKMEFTIGGKWKTSQSLQRALSIRQTNSKMLATDLAVRLFVVAFHSEYLNAYAGHGYYYPLFKCIYLQHYLLLQESVYAVFSGINYNTWTDRIKSLLNLIDQI